MINHNNAQSLIEYGLILGIVTVALITMQVYFKRNIQSVVKVVADDFGQQGEVAGDREIAVKQTFYGQQTADGKEKLPINSKGKSSWVQTKSSLGEGRSQSEISGSSKITGDEPSISVAGDYKDRKIN